MKTSSKQDEAWIMNRLIKQLTDMGFPVSNIQFPANWVALSLQIIETVDDLCKIRAITFLSERDVLSRPLSQKLEGGERYSQFQVLEN